MVLSKDDINYKQCSMSVMDNIADPDITFDEKGVCNYYYEYIAAEKANCLVGDEGKAVLDKIATRIKADSAGKQYDCIVGLSGGADSTYLALLAKQMGLKPLLVHFDYGWNSELAVINIQNASQKLGFDLYTYVMDWEEFKSLQRSYFKASVLDLDVPADHMIFGALFKIAKKFKVKYLLSGNNVWTEQTLPPTWNYNKFDLVNLKDIHYSHSNTKLLKLPKLGLYQYMYYQLVLKIESIQLLNLVEYNKEKIKKIITEQLDWRDYGGKHHESIFTRFYQGYILPNKWHIDKRKAHLSNLIFAGQITKEQALAELAEPPYDVTLQEQDFEYVAKKLDFTTEEFSNILKLPNQEHTRYKTDKEQRQRYFRVMKRLKPVTSIIKKVRG
jgi:N-acetyl sugar amidotransferase